MAKLDPPHEANGSTVNGSIDDERTPLLSTTAQGPTAEPIEELSEPNASNGTQDEDEDKPLPLGQIFLLCFTRLVEPIAFFAIFPYINKMIYETGGIEESDVGFYSGLIESLFSATQMCVMIFWGWHALTDLSAADYFGRKPVLVLSLTGVTAATALFGMSKTIWHMVLFRCLAGIFSGTIVTVRAMISENSTKKTQARAFSYFAFVGNMGIFFGPFIGGALESPANKFPSTFGKMQFFKDYPYAFPGFVSAGFGAVAAIVSALFVKETLHVHHGKNKSGDRSMSTWEILKAPGVAVVIMVYNHVMLLAFAYTAVLPVYLFTPVRLGGTEFSPFLISCAMGGGGLAQAFWLLFVFPPLQHRLGTGGVFRLCAVVWPFFFLGEPICNLLLRHHLAIPFWILGPIILVTGSGVAMCFTGVQLAINDIAPSHETLGTLNALVLALSAGMRAVIPAASTSIYAAGVREQILQGHLFWVILIVLAIALSFMLKFFPEKAEGRIPKSSNNDEA